MARRITAQDFEVSNRKDSSKIEYPVMEIFGPTIQGEGALYGVPTQFIRFGGCGYNCSWCDTKFAVDPKEVLKHRIMMNAETIAEKTLALRPQVQWVTLSGGDPCIHKVLGPVINYLHAGGVNVAVETQGQFWRPWLLVCDLVTLSPKPPSSGMTTDWQELKQIITNLEDYRIPMVLKIVIFEQDDLEYACRISKLYPTKTLYLQAGTEIGSGYKVSDYQEVIAAKTRWLVEVCFKHEHFSDPAVGSYRITPQMHTLLWGDTRGK